VNTDGLTERLLTELTTNSIEHARSVATVVLGTDTDHLVCQVRGSGHLADPLVGRRPETAGQIRGRGLLLVNQLADLVRVHTSPQGTTIEAQFTLRLPPCDLFSVHAPSGRAVQLDAGSEEDGRVWPTALRSGLRVAGAFNDPSIVTRALYAFATQHPTVGRDRARPTTEAAAVLEVCELLMARTR
jgi:hypothetical protein